jgi:hypothetical protein
LKIEVSEEEEYASPEGIKAMKAASIVFEGCYEYVKAD